MIEYTQISPATYFALRYKFVKYFEESNSFSLLPYLDTAANPQATIGLGFNIETGPLDAVLDKFGIADSETAVRQQIRNATASSTTNAQLRSSLNAIMAARAASLGGRSRFEFLSEAEIIAVFTTIAPNYEAPLTNELPNLPVNTLERAILFSLAYNNANALIGLGMQNAVQNGDRAELFYEVRYNSNGGASNRGMAKRRFMESEILGLFNPGPMTNQDAFLAFRMYTKHEQKIKAYDRTWASGRTLANTELAVVELETGLSFGNVLTIDDELVEARAKLISAFGGGLDFDNVWVAALTSAGGNEVAARIVDRSGAGNSRDLIFGGIDNDGNDAGTNDRLVGGGGDDTIIGGRGADQLFGGAGRDVLWSTSPNNQANDNAVDRLTGGADADTYHIDSVNDVVVDTDSSLGEQVLLNGRRLNGGTATKSNPNVYVAKDGTRYTYGSESGGGQAGLMAFSLAAAANYVLEVTSPDGVTVYIEDFLNGEAGIWLRREDDDDALDPESFLSPLVLDLDGDGLELTALGDQQSYFDFGGDGFREATAWVGADDGLLAWDRDGNGNIDDASELFGANPFDAEEIGDQPGGMARLSELDTNRDRIISSADNGFANLVVWQDLDGDGLTQDGELKSLGDLGIASINLDYFRVNESLGDSYLTERSTYSRSDGSTGEISDIWFRIRPTTAVPIEEIEVDADLLDLPFIGSSGLVRDLPSAMQLDPLLEEMVRDLSSLTLADAWRAPQKIEAILLRWTGADEVPPDSRGNWIDARYLTALERWTGDQFVQQAWQDSTNPFPQASAALMKSFHELLATVTVELLAQTELGVGLLPELGYEMDAFLILDADFSVETFVARAVAASPEDEFQQIVHWKGIVTIAQGLAGRAGADAESLASAIDAALATINPRLSYDMLERTIIGSSGADVLTGTSTEIDTDFSNPDPDYWTLPDIGGIDWIVGAAGDDKMFGGYGHDTYVFGRGFGHDTVVDNFGRQYDGEGEQDDAVQLIGDLTLADVEVSLVRRR